MEQRHYREPQLLHRHTAIETAGTVDLKPVSEKIDLHRCAFRIDAVIPMDQRV